MLICESGKLFLTVSWYPNCFLALYISLSLTCNHLFTARPNGPAANTFSFLCRVSHAIISIIVITCVGGGQARERGTLGGTYAKWLWVDRQTYWQTDRRGHTADVLTVTRLGTRWAPYPGRDGARRSVHLSQGKRGGGGGEGSTLLHCTHSTGIRRA